MGNEGSGNLRDICSVTEEHCVSPRRFNSGNEFSSFSSPFSSPFYGLLIRRGTISWQPQTQTKAPLPDRLDLIPPFLSLSALGGQKTLWKKRTLNGAWRSYLHTHIQRLGIFPHIIWGINAEYLLIFEEKPFVRYIMRRISILFRWIWNFWATNAQEKEKEWHGPTLPKKRHQIKDMENEKKRYRSTPKVWAHNVKAKQCVYVHGLFCQRGIGLGTVLTWETGAGNPSPSSRKGGGKVTDRQSKQKKKEWVLFSFPPSLFARRAAIHLFPGTSSSFSILGRVGEVKAYYFSPFPHPPPTPERP